MTEQRKAALQRSELTMDELDDVSGGEIVVTKDMIELDSMKAGISAHGTGSGAGKIIIQGS